VNRVAFHVLAAQELDAAAQYYELESTGLGATFLTEVSRTLTHIVEYPEAGPVLLSLVRRRVFATLPVRRPL